MVQGLRSKRNRSSQTALSLFVRWYNPSGKTKVSQLVLKRIDTVDALQVTPAALATLLVRDCLVCSSHSQPCFNLLRALRSCAEDQRATKLFQSASSVLCLRGGTLRYLLGQFFQSIIGHGCAISIACAGCFSSSSIAVRQKAAGRQ